MLDNLFGLSKKKDFSNKNKLQHVWAEGRTFYVNCLRCNNEIKHK